MRKRLGILLMALALIACAAGPAEAAAASMHREIESADFDVEVTVGYNGSMTYGKVMPVTVRIRNFGGDFEGVLGMNAYADAKQYDRYEREIALPAGSQREFVLPVTVYAKQERFTAEILKDGEVVCAAGGEPKALVNPSAMLIGVLSTRAQNLNNLNIDRESDTLNRYEYWQAIPLTKDSFPEDLSMLKSFGVLVMDDMDPAALSEKQKETLDSWLRSGRVLILGGGAQAGRNAAAFSGYTGLSLEEVTVSEDLIPSLQRTLGLNESGAGSRAAVAVYSGAEPLARDGEGRGLLWRSTAGAGRIYTAAFETGDMKLNSESLMHYFWQKVLVDYDMELYSTLLNYSAGSDNGQTVNAGYYLPVKARSLMLPGALIAAGMAAAACALWLILKKADKRQWMWAALPVISALAAAGVLLLSGGAETNRPMAVIAENIVQDSAGAARSYSGVTVACPEFGIHSYSMAGESLKVQRYDYVDFDEEEDEKKKTEPDEMRTCYTVGGGNGVRVESKQPWEKLDLSVEAEARIRGAVEGAVWMEEDGLHGEITNGTDQKLAAGQVVTTYGYASVPALAPGEKAQVTLKKSVFADPLNPVYRDGEMYAGSTGMYGVIYAATGYTDDMMYSSSREAQEKNAAATLINNAAELLRRGQGNWSYGAYESAQFLYSAKPENMESAELIVDGAPVEKRENAAMLTAELSYETVGRTGILYRSAGMDIPERVETDGNLMPLGEADVSLKNMFYHTLSENPTFRFTIGGLEGARAENLQVILNSYYTGQAAAWALNARTREWEEIKLNTDIPDPGRYLDEKGRLYLQFRSNTQDMYAEIPTPLISLEGRAENAEN